MSSRYLGNYSIQSSLGKGSFGIVHKVERRSDGRVFAMKSISLRDLHISRDRILKEVESHKSFPKHVNILEFVDHIEMSDHLYIVLEHCDLGTLEEYLTGRKLEHALAVSFMADMCRGLGHLHYHGVVHRDIKPENILLSSKGKEIPICKISDFGVANMSMYGRNSGLDSLSEEYFTTLCGTPLYLAPEVTAGHYTKACDIFSLGIVYYMLVSPQKDKEGRLLPLLKTGALFCRADDASIRQQLKERVRNERLRCLISAMLSVDYHQRPGTVSILDRLELVAVPDDEVFLVTCLFAAICLMLLLLPLPLTVLCVVLLLVSLKELVPKSAFTWNVI